MRRMNETEHKTDQRLSAKDKANLLMQKYSLLRAEVLVAMGNYKSQVGYFQFFLTAIIALIPFSIRDGIIVNSRMFWIIVMYAITTMITYVVFAVLESLYQMIALNARLTSLEERINELAEERLLLWETTLSGAFFGGAFAPVKGVWHPDYFLSIYVALLVLAGLFITPVYAGYKFWDDPKEFQYLFRIAVAGALLYSAVSTFIMLQVGVGVLLRFRPGARQLVRDRLSAPE
jgi:hypothetical protein